MCRHLAGLLLKYYVDRTIVEIDCGAGANKVPALFLIAYRNKLGALLILGKLRKTIDLVIK